MKQLRRAAAAAAFVSIAMLGATPMAQASTLYSDNYSGDRLTAINSWYVGDWMNDRASSIVNNNIYSRFYEDFGYQGRSFRVFHNIARLEYIHYNLWPWESWNDRISSFRQG